ncbi:MAG TPA: GNAT family N-acetyltransferase [Nocardioidaceae bacterium]
MLEKAGGFLAGDPVRHNLILTLLQARVAHPEPGRYWTVTVDDDPVGVILQSPLDFVATCTPMPAAAVVAGVDAIANIGVRLPGVSGEAATAARFAGHWTERTRSAAWPVVGQRIYEVDQVVPPRDCGGELRQATIEDRDLVVAWFRAFGAEIGENASASDEHALRRLEAGQLWIWQDGEPVAMAAVSATVEGVARVGPVYTEPQRRNRGYASALVASVSAAVRASGAGCILYTDLGNPTSNSIYRALGYQAVSEVLRYRFDQPS